MEEIKTVETVDMEKLCNDLAIENFKKGLNCCESVFNALCRAGALEGVDPATVAVCTGFGGGVGLSGCICGALAGAIIANGAKYGRPDPYAVEPVEVRMTEIAKRYYMRYNNLLHDFAEANGSPLCKEICSKYEDFHGKDRKVACMKMIGKTAALAYRYLQISQEDSEKMPYQENMSGL